MSRDVSIALDANRRRTGDAWSDSVIHCDRLGARCRVSAAVGGAVGARDRLRAGARRNIADKRNCRDATVIRSATPLSYKTGEIGRVSRHVGITLNAYWPWASDAWRRGVAHSDSLSAC